MKAAPGLPPPGGQLRSRTPRVQLGDPTFPGGTACPLWRLRSAPCRLGLLSPRDPAAKCRPLPRLPAQSGPSPSPFPLTCSPAAFLASPPLIGVSVSPTFCPPALRTHGPHRSCSPSGHAHPRQRGSVSPPHPCVSLPQPLSLSLHPPPPGFPPHKAKSPLCPLPFRPPPSLVICPCPSLLPLSL